MAPNRATHHILLLLNRYARSSLKCKKIFLHQYQKSRTIGWGEIIFSGGLNEQEIRSINLNHR